jgi:hypothetical protein
MHFGVMQAKGSFPRIYVRNTKRAFASALVLEPMLDTVFIFETDAALYFGSYR